MDNEVEKVIIIGSGPAGHTAAIYAARAELSPLMFEGLVPGGQLMITTDVENYPGFPEGIMGPELMTGFRDQAARFNTRMEQLDVTEVDLSQRPFKVVAGEETHLADSIIISTGASARWLGIPGEERLVGRGVSACATCDGFFFRDRHVVVVGGGDSAMEEALFLTKFASKVTVIHRRDSFRASKIMVARLKEHPKVEIIWNTVVDEVIGDEAVESISLTNRETGETSTLACDGFFLAIGHTPNTKLFEGQLDLDETGYILLKNGGSTATSVSGVFAAGDVADTVYRQAITAAGTGCRAAIDAERWLFEHE
jgi:thioredoxin reductase (NADPH)